MTFKENAKTNLIKAAKEYDKLLKFDYHIKSTKFVHFNEYILRFNEDNFLHLTGVETKLKAKIFFNKCLKNDLELDDFVCDSSSELKGKIKEKLKNLLNIGEFFEVPLIFQESFKKNRVECSLATSDGKCTLGFISVKENVCVPVTLLNKNQINEKLQITDFIIIAIRK